MKVIIIGAGLSGLSTAIAFRKYFSNPQLDIRIYDKADPSDIGRAGWNDHADIRQKRQGAVISLQSNALRVLHDLDPELAARVTLAGFPCRGFTWKTEGNVWLGRDAIDVLPISRPKLIECLADALPRDMVQFRTVAGILTKNGARPVVRFADGSNEEADVVVGADGVGSVVRRSLMGDDAQYQPKYHGMCAVGGVLDLQLPASYHRDPTIMFFEGPTGFFCYCGLSQTDDKILYSSMYDTDLPARGVNLDHAAINAHIRDRHRHFADPIIQQCVDRSALDNVYPIFWVPDLPHWGRDGCVLVGDAAHSMPPASGQGGSQAFEDAQTLALLLQNYWESSSSENGNGTQDHAITRAIEGFYALRHGHVDALKAKAISLREPPRPWSIWMTMLVYTGLFLFVNIKNFFKRFQTPGAERVLNWDPKVEVQQFLRAQAS